MTKEGVSHIKPSARFLIYKTLFNVHIVPQLNVSRAMPKFVQLSTYKAFNTVCILNLVNAFFYWSVF